VSGKRAIFFLEGEEIEAASDLPHGCLVLEASEWVIGLDLKAMKFIAANLRRIQREIVAGRDPGSWVYPLRGTPTPSRSTAVKKGGA
jgi:hypothetical protein